jgi:hypothetical protein
VPATAPTPLPARKRKTALALVGIMAAMAVLGLTYALYSAKLRADRHPRPKTIPPPLVIRSPAELPALGYVPRLAPVVVGIHVAALLQDPVGKQVLDKPPALLGSVLKLLSSAGLKLEGLDHVVLALHGPAPELVLIARTRGPYELEKVAQSVQPAEASVFRKRPLFVYAAPLFQDKAVLWGADEQTLVLAGRLGGDEKSGAALLEAVPESPQQGAERLEPTVAKLLEERVPRQSLLWGAGDLERFPLAQAALLFSAPEMAQVKRFVVAAYPQEGLTIVGGLFTGREGAARKLQALLQDAKLPAGGLLKVEGPPPGEPNPEAQWVTLQIRTSGEGIGALAQRGLGK